jgi:hypothetical protein
MVQQIDLHCCIENVELPLEIVFIVSKLKERTN